MNELDRVLKLSAKENEENNKQKKDDDKLMAAVREASKREFKKKQQEYSDLEKILKETFDMVDLEGE